MDIVEVGSNTACDGLVVVMRKSEEKCCRSGTLILKNTHAAEHLRDGGKKVAPFLLRMLWPCWPPL